MYTQQNSTKLAPGQTFLDTIAPAELTDSLPLDPPEDYEWFRVGEEIIHTLPSGKQLFATIIDKDTIEQWVRVEYLFNGRVYTAWVSIHDKVRGVYALQHL